MHTLMIHKSVDPVGLHMSTSYSSVSPTVSTRCQRGWWPIGCSSTSSRPRYSGVRQLVVDIRSQPDKYVLATRLFCRSLPSATSGSTSTLTSPCLLTSPRPSEPVSLHCGRYVVCGVCWHKRPCWRWSAHLSSQFDFCCSVLAGVSGSLMQRLQSVLNATAWLVLSARRSEHTTPLLRELHWLKVSERIQYRQLCVLAFRYLHGLAPCPVTVIPLSPPKWTLVPDSDPRVRQHSSYHPARQSSLGDRSFPVAAARAWNSLPPSVRSTSFFCLHLKTHLFAASFPRWHSTP